MNKAVIHCSLEAIRQLLKLPSDTKLLSVRQTWEQRERGVFEFLVEAPNLPETTPGHEFPWVTITLHTVFCPQDEITHIVKGEITT